MNNPLRVVVSTASFLPLALASNAIAGDSGVTTVQRIIIKESHVEIFVSDSAIGRPTGGGESCDGSNLKRWHLLNQTVGVASVSFDKHVNYDAILSAVLSSRLASAQVDIDGNNECYASGEIIKYVKIVT